MAYYFPARLILKPILKNPDPQKSPDKYRGFFDFKRYTYLKSLIKKHQLESSLLNQINLFLEKDISKKSSIVDEKEFKKDNLIINNEDYYYSNAIARASKTMSECKSSKTKLKSTGTEG